MADDMIPVEEPVAEEPVMDEDLDAAFNEAFNEPKDEPKEEPAKEVKEEPEEESEKPKEPTHPKAKAEEKPKAEPPPAKGPIDLIEERFSELEKGSKETQKDSLDQQLAEAQRQLQAIENQIAERSQQTSGGGDKLTKEHVANLLSILDPDTLPDGPVVIGDNEVDLKAFATEDPQAFNAMKVMAGAIAQQIIGGVLGNADIVSGEQLREVQTRYGDRLAQLEFELNVSRRHPDMHELTELGKDGKPLNEKSKEFVTWLETQSKATKWAAFQSNDPTDAVRVIDAFKEDKAKKAVSEHDKKALEKKEKKDAVMQHSIRSKPTVPNVKIDEDDFEAGFAEVAKGRR